MSLLFVFSFSSELALAHPGRTNASGCHNDNVNGGYHCHNNGSSSSGSSGSGSSSSGSSDFNSPSRSNSTPSLPIDSPGNIIILSDPDPEPDVTSFRVGFVESITDGDTIRVADTLGGISYRVRFACVDAPELDQEPYGDMVKKVLNSLIPEGTEVRLNVFDTDRYGRVVAEVFLGETLLNLQMVAQGMTYVSDEYLNNCDSEAYSLSQEKAMQNLSGLWKYPDLIRPWDWRLSNCNH